MKSLVFAVVFLISVGLAWAQTVPPDGGVPPGDIVAPTERVGGTAPPFIPNTADVDGDGFVAAVDCNDDDPQVNPGAVEKLGGLDDNCDGAVDEGFDTTIDWPAVSLVKPIWPVPTEAVTAGLGEHVSTLIPPRLVWTGDRFMAVWIDVRSRLRVASFDRDGSDLVGPVTLPKQAMSMDVAWTGTRLGIVYEEAFAGTPSIGLATLDRDLSVLDDVVLVASGRDPKVAWGQDRFGVVWNSPPCPNSLRFQRFEVNGRPLSGEEVLVNSGGKAAIVFDGTIVQPLPGGPVALHQGMFGVVYEAHYGFAVTADVLLTAFPRDDRFGEPIGPVRVNQRTDLPNVLGAMPTIAANQTGFLVAWHVQTPGGDGARARFFSHDALVPVEQFIPDADAARYGRLAWTGGDFVMMNDNRTNTASWTFDVHLRRFDPSGNTHVTAPMGAWTEVNMRSQVRGDASVHPDLAVADGVIGGIWVERDPALIRTAGRLWFAKIEHR